MKKRTAEHLAKKKIWPPRAMCYAMGKVDVRLTVDHFQFFQKILLFSAKTQVNDCPPGVLLQQAFVPSERFLSCNVARGQKNVFETTFRCSFQMMIHVVSFRDHHGHCQHAAKPFTA